MFVKKKRRKRKRDGEREEEKGEEREEEREKRERRERRENLPKDGHVFQQQHHRWQHDLPLTQLTIVGHLGSNMMF